MEPMQGIWLALLFGLAVAWTALASRLFAMLREDHSATYTALESPSLLRNNTMRNSWLSLKFLLTGAYRELGDARVTRLGDFMRVFFVAYVALLIGPILWMLVA